MCHPRGLRRSRSTTTTTTSPPPSRWTPFSTPARSNRILSRQPRDHHGAHRHLDLLEPDLQGRLRHGGAEELQHPVAECDAPEGHRSLQDPDGHPEANDAADDQDCQDHRGDQPPPLALSGSHPDVLSAMQIGPPAQRRRDCPARHAGPPSAPSPLARQREAVRDGQHHQVDALVPYEEVVQGAEGDRVVRHVARVGHRAAPEDVVEADHASRAEARQELLVVGAVAGLVGVDEDQVYLRRAREGADGLDGGRDAERDAFGEAGAREVAARDRRPLLVQVAAEEPAVGCQAARDRDRAVAGERPDLDRAARAEHAGQEGEERALLDRDLHPADRAEGGGLARRYHLVLLDNRDAGASDEARGPYGTGDMAADALGVIDHLGIERFHVVGASMGGAIAQHLALLAPTRVATLTLVATWGRTDAFLATILASWRLMVERLSPEQFLAALAPWAFTYRFLEAPAPEVVALQGAARERGLLKSVAAYQRQVDACVAHDTLALLPLLRTPSLVLVGEDDILTPPRYARALGAALPRGEVVLVPAGGHACFLEPPKPLAERVLRFLARHPLGA